MLTTMIMKETMKNDIPHMEIVDIYQKKNDKNIDVVIWLNEQNKIFNVTID